jgi:hypothetical protein
MASAERMNRYEREAPELALKAVERLGLGEATRQITHLNRCGTYRRR